jgi:hypothetical protein
LRVLTAGQLGWRNKFRSLFVQRVAKPDKDGIRDFAGGIGLYSLLALKGTSRLARHFEHPAVRTDLDAVIFAA